jgi:hypothetical protein
MVDFTNRTIGTFGCVECDLGKYRIISPGRLIYDGTDFTVHPRLDKHSTPEIIVSTKRHTASLDDLTAQEAAHVADAMAFLCKAMKDLGIAKNPVTQIKTNKVGHMQLVCKSSDDGQRQYENTQQVMEDVVKLRGAFKTFSV